MKISTFHFNKRISKKLIVRKVLGMHCNSSGIQHYGNIDMLILNDLVKGSTMVTKVG